MSLGKVRRLKIVIVLALSVSSPVFGGEDDMSAEQLNYLSTKWAIVRVAVDHAPFFATPEPGAQPIWSASWVNRLDVDTPRVKGAPAGWIPIKAIGPVKGRAEDVPGGWVRRRDVVLPGDYRKVLGCWPIKSLVFVAGDYAAEVTFKLDGSASVKEQGDEEWISKVPPHKAHVFMARNIVEIDDLEGKAGFFTSGYRAGERRLYPEGARAEEQELFPGSMLAGCKTVPLLDNESVPVLIK